MARLQTNLKGVKYLIIGWINRRCKEATGHSTVPFGGISLIIVGDIGQLLSTSDQIIYHSKPTNDIAL